LILVPYYCVVVRGESRMDYLEKLKELLAKVVTVGATVFISSNGFDALFVYTGGGGGEALKLVSLIAGYAVWTQVLVPFVDAAFKEATKTTASSGPSWNTRSKLY